MLRTPTQSQNKINLPRKASRGRIAAPSGATTEPPLPGYERLFVDSGAQESTSNIDFMQSGGYSTGSADTSHIVDGGQSRHPVIYIGTLFGIADGFGEILIPKV